MSSTPYIPPLKRPSFFLVYLHLIGLGVVLFLQAYLVLGAVTLTPRERVEALISALLLAPVLFFVYRRRPSGRVVLILANYGLAASLFLFGILANDATQADIRVTIWGAFWGTYFWRSEASKAFYRVPSTPSVACTSVDGPPSG